MYTIGTAHFVSKAAAVRYYREYGFSAADVERKLADGEIGIGMPSTKPDEELFVREGRYHLQIGH
jgi:hypothetical protein